MAPPTTVMQEVGQSLPPDTPHVSLTPEMIISELTDCVVLGRQCFSTNMEILCRVRGRRTMGAKQDEKWLPKVR